MASEEINIENAGFEDLNEIWNLQKRAFRTEAEMHGNYNIEPLTQTFESVCEDFNEYSFLKATYKDSIIGSVKSKLSGDCVWLGKLMVFPDFRGKGLGKKLLLAVEKQYPGIKKFQLFTAAVSSHNIRLYESIGYRICNRYTDEQQSGLEMVEMIKEI